MATSSEEFFLGSVFLVCGCIYLAFRWMIVNTSVGRAMLEACREEEPIPDFSLLDSLRLIGFVSLLLGTVLIIAAVVAYRGV